MPRPLDVESICAPIGRIAARHAPMDSGVATDLSDAAGAVVGVAGYVQHNFTTIAQLQAGVIPPAQPNAAPAPASSAETIGPDASADSAPAPGTPEPDGPWNPAGDPPAAAFHDVFPPPPSTGLG